jgi:hypothetical protein
MKLVICIAAAVAVVSIAYALGPDVARYMKIRSM